MPVTPVEYARWLASQAPPPSEEALDAALDALDEARQEREANGGDAPQ